MKMFKFMMVLGVFMWTFAIVWLARLAMGLEHIYKSDIPGLILCGVAGGWAGWAYVASQARRFQAAEKEL
ncbi:hypothetical protein ACYOEI_23850 [Singulisphaera rosea]